MARAPALFVPSGLGLHVSVVVEEHSPRAGTRHQCPVRYFVIIMGTAPARRWSVDCHSLFMRVKQALQKWG